MRTKSAALLSGAIVALMFVVSFALGPRLPETMVTHWNAAGQPDDTMPRVWGQFTVPLVTTAVVALTFVSPKIDPKRKNIEAFRELYNDFVVVLAAFLALAHGVVLAINLGYDVPINAVIYAGVGLLVVFLGTLLGQAKQNWIVGIRTPWTLSDETVWDRTHAVGAWLFRLSGILALVGAFAGEFVPYLVVGPVLLSSLALVGYSYYLFTRGADGDDVTPS